MSVAQRRPGGFDPCGSGSAASAEDGRPPAALPSLLHGGAAFVRHEVSLRYSMFSSFSSSRVPQAAKPSPGTFSVL